MQEDGETKKALTQRRRRGQLVRTRQPVPAAKPASLDRDIQAYVHSLPEGEQKQRLLSKVQLPELPKHVSDLISSYIPAAAASAGVEIMAMVRGLNKELKKKMDDHPEWLRLNRDFANPDYEDVSALAAGKTAYRTARDTFIGEKFTLMAELTPEIARDGMSAGLGGAKNLEALLKTFYKQGKGGRPYLNNYSDLVVYLASFSKQRKVDNRIRAYEIARETATLPQWYKLLSNALWVSASFGELDDYGFPKTFIRQDNMNAIFAVLRDVEYPEFDMQLDKFHRRIRRIADWDVVWKKKHKYSSPEIYAAHEQTLNDKLQALCERFCNDILFKPELLPEPIRFVMSVGAGIIKHIAPTMPEAKMHTYLSGFLLTRFIVPRCTKPNFNQHKSQRERSVSPDAQRIITRMFGNPLQWMITNPGKLPPYAKSFEKAAKYFMQEVSYRDPYLTESIDLRQRYNELAEQVQEFSARLSPRRRKSNPETFNQIKTPSLQQIDDLVGELKAKAKRIKDDPETCASLRKCMLELRQLSKDIKANIYHYIEYSIARYLNKMHFQPMSPRADAKKQILNRYFGILDKVKLHREPLSCIFKAIYDVNKTSDGGDELLEGLLQSIECKTQYSRKQILKMVTKDLENQSKSDMNLQARLHKLEMAMVQELNDPRKEVSEMSRQSMDFSGFRGGDAESRRKSTRMQPLSRQPLNQRPHSGPDTAIDIDTLDAGSSIKA